MWSISGLIVTLVPELQNISDNMSVMAAEGILRHTDQELQAKGWRILAKNHKLIAYSD